MMSGHRRAHGGDVTRWPGTPQVIDVSSGPAGATCDAPESVVIESACSSQPYRAARLSLRFCLAQSDFAQRRFVVSAQLQCLIKPLTYHSGCFLRVGTHPKNTAVHFEKFLLNCRQPVE